MNDVIWVWGESVNPANPAPPPTVSVSAWPYLFDQEWLRWREGGLPDAARTCKLAFVNLFHTEDSTHIMQIRRANPECVIVAMPDPWLDLVLAHPQWRKMWYQMLAADVIGGRTHYDCNVYGSLLNKPSEVIPSPIGPTEWYLPFRDLPDDDYILTLDHPMQNYVRATNVAALAVIQRQTGMRVIYAAARDETREYADLAGLECEWPGHVPFRDFVEMTARAKICVDVAPRHSYGRQLTLCAMVGTPCVRSEWTGDWETATVDPFTPDIAAQEAFWLLDHPEEREAMRQHDYNDVGCYEFDYSRWRIKQLMEKYL